MKLGNEGRTQRDRRTRRQATRRSAQDMHAILRQKTLLGETYMQLIPEGNSGPRLLDGQRLPNSQVEPSVTLDDILSAFDAEDAGRLPDLAEGRSRKGSTAAGNRSTPPSQQLEPFVEHANKLVTLLDEPGRGGARARAQHGRRLQRARQPRPPARRLIANGERTFHAAAEASQAFAEAFKRAADVRAQLDAWRSKKLDRFAAIANPFFEGIPADRAPALGAAAAGQAVRASVQQLPDRARAADEGREDRACPIRRRRSS